VVKAEGVVVVFLKYLVTGRIVHIYLAIAVLVGEGKAGVAKMVFDAVFVAEGISGGRTRVRIEYAALAVRDAFEAQR
jgi:hypothetical protein